MSLEKVENILTKNKWEKLLNKIQCHKVNEIEKNTCKYS
jgi:hypothetical protein